MSLHTLKKSKHILKIVQNDSFARFLRDLLVAFAVIIG
jgi:hypothetical protein